MKFKIYFYEVSILICLLVFTFVYSFNMFIISILYHRALAHGSLQLSPWARKLTFRFGPFITGIDPKAWVLMHRLHHLHSDTPRDPHSPLNGGSLRLLFNQLKGYKAALLQAIRNNPETRTLLSDISEEVSFLYRKRLWFLPYLLSGLIALIIAGLFGDFILAAAFFIGIMSHPLQGWLVNCFGHRIGYRNYETPDNSRNNWLIAILLFGEGYQNNHHACPERYSFAHKKWEVDLAVPLIFTARCLGILSIKRR